MIKPKFLGGLGFRDMEIFNLDLLARQAWRLLTEPSFLSARILKSVYFPKANFLDAELGSSPSRIWRAIIEGKEVLSQGLIRRIGNGETTKVWSDNWLPREGWMRPIRGNCSDPTILVSELINGSTRAWDQAKLDALFTPLDREVISNIPLCTNNQEDFWAW